MDTPERGERCSKEAKDRLSGLAGHTVRVESGPRATGPYGRPLYYVYTMVGHSVEAIFIREGLGELGGKTACTAAIWWRWRNQRGSKGLGVCGAGEAGVQLIRRAHAPVTS